MTILVTGATGFLGSALVTELLRQKQEVRILVRDAQKARAQFGTAVQIIQGEITDEEKVQEAVYSATTIYHLAGRLYHPSTPARLYEQTHIEGTRILLKACETQKLQRFIHCSTTGVLGATGETPASEDAPFSPTNPYERTKLEGETLALQAHRMNSVPVTVVRPGLVYGPGDLHLLNFFTTIKKGIVPPLIDGGKAKIHPVYISDMTTAFLLCAERPEAIGHSYNIAGASPVTFCELATAIAHAMGKKLPSGSIPLPLANFASDVFAVLPGLKGEKAPLTRSRVQFLTNSRIYSIERARHDLGYEPEVGLEEGMKQTAAWYQKHNYI
ncbi:MAG: NAD-dependent epimerase/dehydratase family protein [Ktedonobacteraceae bacterium]|nr:NAD-dependent epimerase/dehydratase family protein [Ktedonobacteraceae bacterium]